MKLPVITIAIPAHNEGSNIRQLLEDIVCQDHRAFILREILIASDGSTDKTNTIIKKFKDKRIKISIYKQRKGKAIRENQLIQKTQGDILVILDGDIVISDPQFIKKLITPLINKQAEMTSAAIHELNPQTFFEKIIYVSMKLKHALFSSFKDGNNLYNCHGPARAFHKTFFQQLIFTISDGEDMFSYLFCISKNLRFQYVPDAAIQYRLPSTFADHKKQSVRFSRAQVLMRQTFGNNLVDQEIKIPFSAYLHGFSKCAPILARYPIHTIAYLTTLTVVKWTNVKNSVKKDSWQVESTKIVRA